MSWLAFILTLSCFLLVFAEFGGRIRASNALGWWLLAAFLLIAAAAPDLFHPVADTLGIALVSNFVMAATIIFLFVQVLQLSANQTFEARKLRAATARIAADQFLRNNRPEGAAAAGAAADATHRRALIVLPCFNEEGSIPDLVPRLEALKSATAGWHIDSCFVDDGSTDATRSILNQLAPKGSTSHVANGGVACVLMTGFLIALDADYDYVVQCDGDGQHPVEQIGRLLTLAKTDGVDLLIGSRFASPSASAAAQLASTTWLRRVGSLVLVSVLRLLWPGTQTTDPTSGFRVFSRRASYLLTRYMPDGFPEAEAIGLCHAAGLRVAEAAVEMSPRLAGHSSISGIRSVIYMYKTISALIGLRLRTLAAKQPLRAVAGMRGR